MTIGARNFEQNHADGRRLRERSRVRSRCTSYVFPYNPVQTTSDADTRNGGTLMKIKVLNICRPVEGMPTGAPTRAGTQVVMSLPYAKGRP